jgi:hypothetical protein
MAKDSVEYYRDRIDLPKIGGNRRDRIFYMKTRMQLVS